MPVGDIFAKAHAEIPTTLDIDGAKLALEAAANGLMARQGAAPGEWLLTGPFAFGGRLRTVRISGRYQAGNPAKIVLDGALSEPTDADERRYRDFIDAVNHGAEQLIEDVKARVTILEGIVQRARKTP